MLVQFRIRFAGLLLRDRKQLFIQLIAAETVDLTDRTGDLA